MQTRYGLNSLFLLVLLDAATAADGQVQPQLAQRYFEEAKTLCERDAGRLWGVSLLCSGPLSSPLVFSARLAISFRVVSKCRSRLAEPRTRVRLMRLSTQTQRSPSIRAHAQARGSQRLCSLNPDTSPRYPLCVGRECS